MNIDENIHPMTAEPGQDGVQTPGAALEGVAPFSSLWGIDARSFSSYIILVAYDNATHTTRIMILKNNHLKNTTKETEEEMLNEGAGVDAEWERWQIAYADRRAKVFATILRALRRLRKRSP